MTRAHEEIVDFIASGARSEDVAAYEASDQVRERVADLIHRSKTTGLSSEETAELGHYMELEHLMRLAKARARVRLAHE